MKNYKLEIDVLEAVQDFYPGLSTTDACKIADLIVDKWDYTHVYDTIDGEISWYANSLDIDLEGKDGITEETDNIYVLNPPNTPLFP